MHRVITFLFLSLVLIGVCGNTSFAMDTYSLAREGGEMDAAKKDLLEQKVVQSPDDIETRIKLLGYYFIKGRKDQASKLKHVLWLIENAPDSEVLGSPYGQLDKILYAEGYEQAKQAWLKKLKDSPENFSALANATDFMLLHDRKTAEDLLLRGQKAQPTIASWPLALGRLYQLGLTSLPDGPSRKMAAEKAYRQFDLAYGLSDGVESNSMLDNLAKTAFEAGLIDEAKKHSAKMLLDHEKGWNQGNLVHHGNLILGRIALSENNVEEAKSRLLAAGRTTGSPQLDSFGPNMMLAKELLEIGERDVVLEYFELCKTFWKSPDRGLEQWIEDVKADRVPRFGGNLAY